ncbi:MAG: CDP-alcohol phosphatidyltransferase family protein [Actinomycetota bacterium]|nr:CDP-alcohol phosphatidyltransferase family protein [Actinomycetota bacterium]
MIDGRRGRTNRAPLEAAAPATLAWWRRLQVGQRLARVGVTADMVTIVGVLIAAATAVTVGTGHLYVGVALITVGGLMDALDGAVAKAGQSSSPRGAFFDSVADRLSDFLIFGGVAWYLLDRPDPRLALLPLAILGVSSLISYQRAKAESLGFNAKGGLMERAERLILLSAALLFHIVLVPLLWLLLALCIATAVGRFRRVWRQASGVPAPLHRFGSPVRMESRWRMLREAGAHDHERAARRRARRARRVSTPLSMRVRTAFGVEATPAKRPGRERSVRALRRRVTTDR